MDYAKHRNGIRHSFKIKNKAILLRKQGQSLREISTKLGISLNSIYLWTKNITLTKNQKTLMAKRGYEKYLMYVKNNPQKFIEYANKNLTTYKYQKKFNQTDLLREIKDFHSKNNRIPLKREFDRRIFREYFGTWNNAIKLAGFEPNPVKYSKKCKADDGHTCDSFAEKIIDDWLSKNRINHERNTHYANTKMTADFKVEKNIIEFFGLRGAKNSYDAIIRKKQKHCIQQGIKLIEIYPEELFAGNVVSYLDDKLGKLLIY